MEQFKHHVSLHKDGTYSVGVSIDQGYMTPSDFRILSDLADKYEVTTLMATTAKKINFMDVKEAAFRLDCGPSHASVGALAVCGQLADIADFAVKLYSGAGVQRFVFGAQLVFLCHQVHNFGAEGFLLVFHAVKIIIAELLAQFVLKPAFHHRLGKCGKAAGHFWADSVEKFNFFLEKRVLGVGGVSDIHQHIVGAVKVLFLFKLFENFNLFAGAFRVYEILGKLCDFCDNAVNIGAAVWNVTQFHKHNLLFKNLLSVKYILQLCAVKIKAEIVQKTCPMRYRAGCVKYTID